MVKIPNRPPTPIEPRYPAGPPVPPEICADLSAQVPLEAGALVRVNDRIFTQVRDGRVRVMSRGQVIGWIVDPESVPVIVKCHEAGRAYIGHVVSVAGRTAVVALEGSR